MKILGIETSTVRGDLAIVEGGSAIAEIALAEGKTPSESLFPSLISIMKDKGLGISDIGGIAVGLGPGSFTGIRMGLAAAKGLSMSLGIPLVGIGSFDLLAADYGGRAETLCPIASAHSYGIYCALYRRREGGYSVIRDPFVCQLEDLAIESEDIFFLGPHLSRFRELLDRTFRGRASFDDRDRSPRALTAARLFDSPVAVRESDDRPLVPIYLLPGVRTSTGKLTTRNDKL